MILVSSRTYLGPWALVRAMWIGGTIVCGLYMTFVYLLPLVGLIQQPPVPLKLTVEIVVCALPVLSGGLLTSERIRNDKLSVFIDEQFLVIQLDGHVIVTCVLELASVPSSIVVDPGKKPRYNTAMLLALRAGLDSRVSIAYEVGVERGEPFLRLFITVSGKNLAEMKEILRREATRTEAILLASLNGVEVHQLGEDKLRGAVEIVHHIDSLKEPSALAHGDGMHQSLTFVSGIPRVAPSIDASQVGTFISTAIKQGYSVTLTCVFSSAKAGRERRRMEGEWKNIRAKELRNEESLADHATKRKLLDQHERIQGDSGWFYNSVYVHAKARDAAELERVTNGVNGLVASIWGGEENISLKKGRIRGRTACRFLTRRHLKRQKIHVSSLVGYVNTPVQQLPVIAATMAPVFPVPLRELIENDLIIGKTIYGGRLISDIGIKPEWLREHVAVLGATGTGKTNLVKKLMLELSLKTNVPWWIFDIKGSEYADLAGWDSSILILSPGEDASFVMDLLDTETDSSEIDAHATFTILRELINERGLSSELSPAMEKLLRESVVELAKSKRKTKSVQALNQIISKLAGNDRFGNMTRDALLNRLEILSREPLGSILKGGAKALKISTLLNKRVVFDMRHVARVGGMDAVRILYNLVAKRIFDSAMRRGIKPGLHHVVVLEEASNLVPESYTRHSAADVTTGESMVMLQRATGQGVIVVSTRPNISSNILANTATKITFRLPYDSSVGARYMALNAEQEEYLKSLKCGRALIHIPSSSTFEIATKLFGPMSEASGQDVKETVTQDCEKTENGAVVHEMRTITEPECVVFDRLGELANHVVAFLASRDMATEIEIRSILMTLDSQFAENDIAEIIRDFVSLGTIAREALSLVPGGFVFTLPGRELEAVKDVIMDYIIQRLDSVHNFEYQKLESNGAQLIVGNHAILILPNHLKASSIELVLERIGACMSELGNNINKLVVVVRGSIAAAKLRELISRSEAFDDVTVISAFPSSINNVVDELVHGRSHRSEIVEEQPSAVVSFSESEKIDLRGAVHEVGSATSRAVQMRLWFGLIEDFVGLSDGHVAWDALLEFIETTALQSLKGRSAPMSVEEGKRALTELLADEVLVALRVGGKKRYTDFEKDLWIVNSAVLGNLKERAINLLIGEIGKQNGPVSLGHEYYDFCVGKKSYVVFPTQQQLNTLLNLHSDLACRICGSTQVICLLTAAEYLDDSAIVPANLTMKTMDDAIAEMLI